VEFGSSESVASGDMREPHEGVHEGELSWWSSLRPGMRFRRSDRGFSQFPELAAIDEGLQNVLLDVQIVVVDR
jgi:hypothetical protein